MSRCFAFWLKLGFRHTHHCKVPWRKKKKTYFGQNIHFVFAQLHSYTIFKLHWGSLKHIKLLVCRNHADVSHRIFFHFAVIGYYPIGSQQKCPTFTLWYVSVFASVRNMFVCLQYKSTLAVAAWTNSLIIRIAVNIIVLWKICVQNGELLTRNRNSRAK